MMKGMRRSLRLLVVLLLGGIGTAYSQTTTSFNFTAAAVTVAGWTNVAGDPSTAVRSATAPSGIKISSVATANWSQYSSASAYNGLGVDSNGVFPAAVLYNHWYSYDGQAVYSSSKPQLTLSGLNQDSVYTLRMAGSSTSSLNGNPTLYTVVGLINYGAYGLNNHGNVHGSVIFNNVSPDSTGSIRIYVNTTVLSNVADICGLVVTSAPLPAGRLLPGIGVMQRGQTLALGDSIAVSRPHMFMANRYQYLNGHQYSIDGSVKEPVGHPAARLYDNGNLAFSSTMDTGVSTIAQTGLRFNSKTGVLQIGGTTRVDTGAGYSPQTAPFGGDGIVINSMDSTGYYRINQLLYDSYLQGAFYLDTSSVFEVMMLTGVRDSIFGGYDDGDIIAGTDIRISGAVTNSTISGSSMQITGPAFTSNISGYGHSSLGFLNCGLISGAYNQFGGPFQMATGVNLMSRSPSGAALGSGNVDFPSVPDNGCCWANTPILGSYPVVMVGNAANLSVRSNALTVLYNGRTQINTAGFSNNLTQTGVTPQAALDVVSTNTGVLFPRLSGVQRGAIVPADLKNGLLFYNTDSSLFQYYNGSAWSGVGAWNTSRWQLSANSNFDSLDYLGIGTSNPQGYRLAVNGTAIFTKMVVKPQASWPDYVFQPGYRLRSPEQLEHYIETSGHLPEEPSAEEAVKNGVDLGAGQEVLLKKVEELTLYVIALNKRAEALKQDNVRLRKQYQKDHLIKSK